MKDYKGEIAISYARASLGKQGGQEHKHEMKRDARDDDDQPSPSSKGVSQHMSQAPNLLHPK